MTAGGTTDLGANSAAVGSVDAGTSGTGAGAATTEGGGVGACEGRTASLSGISIRMSAASSLGLVSNTNGKPMTASNTKTVAPIKR